MVKVKGQSVRKIEWKETDGQMDGGNCITAYAVSNDRPEKK